VAGEQQKLNAPLVVQDVGFDAPESVLYDARADLYLVSNVAGTALGRDDQAFISRVGPDGNVAALKWIDAAQPGVLLNAPKGMVLVDDVLYVTDIDCIAKFERVSGRPLGRIAVAGASFLHDLTVDRAGTLYVSDSGLGEGLSASGTDAIYRLSKDGTLSTVVKSRSLGQPSGLWSDGDDLWVTSFGTGELYRLSASGERSAGQRLSKGSLDGIVMHERTLFVSSWEAGAVYERTQTGFEARLTGLDAPADLGLDTKRKRLLITHYNLGALSIHQL
jgi:sugar lactone lactonase YvrE